MIQNIIELIAFKRVTRDILKGTNKTSLNDTLDCINYLKRHNIKTNNQVLKHLYEMSKM